MPPENKPERPTKRTAGGKKLGKILKRLGITITDLAVGAKVNRITLHRVIEGDRYERITVGFARRVVDYIHSLGADDIAIEDFDDRTAVPYENPDRPKVVAAESIRRTGTGG